MPAAFRVGANLVLALVVLPALTNPTAISLSISPCLRHLLPSLVAPHMREDCGKPTAGFGPAPSSARGGSALP